MLECAVRERQSPSGAPRVEWRAELHTDEATHLRRMAAFVLIVLERVGTDTGKAAHRKLWLGATWTTGDGPRSYIRGADAQGGLARRLGVTVRQLERYIAILEAAGVWRAWQPKERGARAPEALPRHLRGEVYAYQHYQLIGGVPRQLRDQLERFYGKRSAPSSSTSPTAAPSSSTSTTHADDELAAAIADLSPELARFLPKPRPPD